MFIYLETQWCEIFDQLFFVMISAQFLVIKTNSTMSKKNDQPDQKTTKWSNPLGTPGLIDAASTDATAFCRSTTFTESHICFLF